MKTLDVDGIIPVVSTLLGTLLGWWLNFKSSQREKKPKLCFVLEATQNQDELPPPELRDKYSDSGYGITIYNSGSTPVVLDCFRVYFKKIIFTDALLQSKIIKPYEEITYELSQQEFGNFQEHCKKHAIKKCKIIARDIAENKIRGKINTEWLIPGIYFGEQ